MHCFAEMFYNWREFCETLKQLLHFTGWISRLRRQGLQWQCCGTNTLSPGKYLFTTNFVLIANPGAVSLNDNRAIPNHRTVDYSCTIVTPAPSSTLYPPRVDVILALGCIGLTCCSTCGNAIAIRSILKLRARLVRYNILITLRRKPDIKNLGKIQPLVVWKALSIL